MNNNNEELMAIEHKLSQLSTSTLKGKLAAIDEFFKYSNDLAVCIMHESGISIPFSFKPEYADRIKEFMKILAIAEQYNWQIGELLLQTEALGFKPEISDNHIDIAGKIDNDKGGNYE